MTDTNQNNHCRDNSAELNSGYDPENDPNCLAGKPGKKGVARLLDAVRYSHQGFAAAWRFEEAFRLEVIGTLIFTPLAFLLAQTHIELILLLSCMIWTLIAELINSAIEAVVDRTGAEKHVLSGRAKDIGSAVVMLSIGLSLLVWGIIAWHRFAT